jgi:uncharacterized protein
MFVGRRRAAALAFILTATLATVAVAERRVALVIGNDQYQNLPILQKAVADARRYADLLKAKGFDEVLFKSDLTRGGLDAAIASFVEQIAPGDTAVFAYSGHGWSDGTQNYIVGTDAPASGSQDFLARISIPLKNGINGIIDEMDQKGATLKVAIIDACRSNPFTPPAGKRSFGLARGLARIDPPNGTFVVFSAGAGQGALDRLSDDDPDPNSVFTRVFAAAIQSDMPLQEAIKATQQKVVALARSIGEDQKPAYYDEVTGSACLSAECNSGDVVGSVPPRDPSPNNAEVAYWNSIVNSTDRADFESYLKDYPGGVFVALAHNRLAALDAAARPVELAPAVGAVAPSFDCRLASLPAERAICDNPELSDLDSRLGHQFSALVSIRTGNASRVIRVDQQRWLQGRNSCGSDTACLADSYRARLQQLAQLDLDTPRTHNPSFNCAAASLPSELTICGDPDLSDLDSQLGHQFLAFIGSRPAGAAGAIRTAQQRWLQGRNGCGSDKECLTNSYWARLVELTQR